MPKPRSILAALLFVPTLAAQQGKSDKPEPVALVTQAEKQLKKKTDVEDAVLLLWQALDQLLVLAANPVNDATAMSARFLLNENDPREAQRRTVFASVAKQQVELATAYRTKKWLDTAATRLDVADRYDRDAGTKERAAIAAARPKAPAAPRPATDAPKATLSPLLQRANSQLASGTWKEVDDLLEVHVPPNDHDEWVTKAQHADNEVVVEFRPVDAAAAHNAALSVGQVVLAGTNNYSGYRIHCQYFPSDKQYGIRIYAIVGMEVKELGESWVHVVPTPGQFQRLSVRVNGKRLRAQLNAGQPIEVDAGQDVRGAVGLLVGLSNASTCAIQFRNLRIDPLPADAPTDDELRAQADAENQNEIAKAVEVAKDLLAKKQPEAASLQLREALDRVGDMPPGVLRDNLAKSIEPMLTQADSLTSRRRKTAQTIAAELGVLADEYGKAGWHRAALLLCEQGAGFDPQGQAARVEAARDAVHKWNVAQAAARASELVPPTDDGTVLRTWFAKGRKLESGTGSFAFEEAVARSEPLANGRMATWVAHPLAPKANKVSVHVHLPAPGAQAGLLFDIVDSAHYGLVVLDRGSNRIRLAAFLKLSSKWVPLLSRDVPMDAWRRDGWHRITIEVTEKGLVASCGATRLEVPRKLMSKATGVFGLYASNDAPLALALELRAFAAEPLAQPVEQAPK